ncbi:hypothetical protein HMI55_003296 [Coelomomyces lativittatus]|nr:hypothetical protein HMI55_003296 [Coelomomyces lativittatus]
MLQHYLLPTLPLPFPFLLLLLVLYFLHYLTPYIHDLGFSKNPHKVYIVNWFKSHSFPSWIKLRTVSLCIHSFVLVHLSLPHLGYFLFCDFIEKDRGKNEDFKKRNTNPPSSLYSYPKGSDQDVKRVMKVLRRDSWKCNELRKMHTTTTTTTMKENHEEKEKINKLDIVFNPHQLEEERRGQTPIQNEENEGGQPMDSEEDKENENVEEEEDEEEDEEEEEEEDSDMEEDDENDQDEAVEDDEEEEDEENGEEDDDEDDDEEEDDEDEEEDEENENENENEVEEDDEDENEEDEHGRLENGLEATDKGVKNDVEEEDEDEDDDDDDDDEERNGNEGEGEGDEEDEEEEEVLGMIDFSEFPILDPETDAIRKEAMESLREIEQSFQRLRLALFDERMGHLRLEEIHIKEGTFELIQISFLDFSWPLSFNVLIDYICTYIFIRHFYNKPQKEISNPAEKNLNRLRRIIVQMKMEG